MAKLRLKKYPIVAEKSHNST